MLTTLHRLSLALLGITIALIAIGPWVLYEWGLSNVNGRPSLSTTMISNPAEAAALWRQLKEHSPIRIEALTPHRYLIGLGNYGLPVGTSVAWLVARDYNQTHLEKRQMIWWHFSGAALTIWLTRNWSAEQLLSKAKEITQHSEHVPNMQIETDSLQFQRKN